MSEPVTLKEDLLSVIDRKSELLSERLDGHVKRLAEADVLARAELHRRLDILNHAHEEARRILNTYAPRELVDQKIEELFRDVSSLKATVAGFTVAYHQIAQLLEWRSTIDSWRSRMLGIAIGAALGGGLTGSGLVAIIVKLMGGVGGP